MLVSEEQVDVYISNLRGRLTYETKKAAKQGFSTIKDYVRDKLTKDAEAFELSKQATPSTKRLKSKPKKKKKAAPISSCGCCP